MFGFFEDIDVDVDFEVHVDSVSLSPFFISSSDRSCLGVVHDVAE